MAKKTPKEVYIERAHAKWGNVFDYSKLEDIKSTRRAGTVVCPIHGETKLTISYHEKYGCKECYHDEFGVYPQSSDEAYTPTAIRTLMEVETPVEVETLVEVETPVEVETSVETSVETPVEVETSVETPVEVEKVKQKLTPAEYDRLYNEELARREAANPLPSGISRSFACKRELMQDWSPKV